MTARPGEHQDSPRSTAASGRLRPGGPDQARAMGFGPRSRGRTAATIGSGNGEATTIGSIRRIGGQRESAPRPSGPPPRLETDSEAAHFKGASLRPGLASEVGNGTASLSRTRRNSPVRELRRHPPPERQPDQEDPGQQHRRVDQGSGHEATTSPTPHAFRVRPRSHSWSFPVPVVNSRPRDRPMGMLVEQGAKLVRGRRASACFS